MAPGIKRSGVLLILCLYCCIAAYPLFTVPEWYGSHERERYLYLVKEFRLAFDSGIAYPRWAPRLLNGYGYPTFLFYQPGVFFFLLPFTYLPVMLTLAFKLAIFCMFFISAAGSYKLARLFGMDRFVSAVCSGICLFLPYVYVDLYVRGDLSEFFAMMLCPWVMLGILRIQRDAAGPAQWSSLAIYVLALSAVFISHPHVMLFIIPIVGWFAVIDWIADGWRSRAAWLLLAGGVMATVLTAPYWVTVLQLAPYVALQGAMLPIHENLTWQQNFFMTDPPQQLPWWLVSSGMVSLFYILLPLAGLAMVIRRRLFWQVLPSLAMVIFMNTNQSLPVWQFIPGSGYIQFAWRILTVAGVLQYIAFLQLGALRDRIPVMAFRLGAVAIVIAGFFCQPTLVTHADNGSTGLRLFALSPFFGSLSPMPSVAARESPPVVNNIFANVGEFTPLWVKSDALEKLMPDQHVQAGTSSGSLIPAAVDEGLWPCRIRGTVDIATDQIPSSPATLEDLPSVTMKQVYFPGWAIWVDEERIAAADGGDWRKNPTVSQDMYGRIRISFPHPGHYVFDSYYEGPPYWQLRNMVMYLCMTLLCWASMRYRLVRPLRIIQAASEPK